MSMFSEMKWTDPSPKKELSTTSMLTGESVILVGVNNVRDSRLSDNILVLVVRTDPHAEVFSVAVSGTINFSHSCRVAFADGDRISGAIQDISNSRRHQGVLNFFRTSR